MGRNLPAAARGDVRDCAHVTPPGYRKRFTENLHGVAQNPIERILRDEIAARGSISFERFMEAALYHPAHGYYRRAKKPIGAHGDFYTASQLQPVFGVLIRGYIERLSEEHNLPRPHSMIEFGAGRGEMAEAFAGWHYQAVEAGSPAPDLSRATVIFANELFDAMPVVSAIRAGSACHERRVTWERSRFQWIRAEEPSASIAAYASRFGAPAADGFEFEVHHRSIEFLEGLLRGVNHALCVFIDYGYLERDWKRFPAGTLMSYRAHRADTDVLADPGSRDITSHIPFHALAETARGLGAEVLRLESLASALLHAGEKDEFRNALGARGAREEMALRQQLKSLLFGFGESFQVIAILKRDPV